VEACRRLSRAAYGYNAVMIPPATEYSIAAKVFCTQASFEVASAAVQIHGGYGLSKQYLVEKLFRDARASLIEDGTNEVLGLVAARKLTSGYGTAGR
jgi:alkylation response protein AidB-like acyl-CoA dehydrogenase